MKQYLELLTKLVSKGDHRMDRTGVGTRSLFGEQLRFDLQQGFPLLTTKRVFFRAVVIELLWFLRGETNVKSLHEQGVTIWDEWARPTGDLGPIYGFQWRNWRSGGIYWDEKTPHTAIDQIEAVLKSLRNDPTGRRHIVSAWNVADIPDMALPPCHILFQFYVSGGKLSCHMYQRSADIFLGVPFNIASYALLTHMFADVLGLGVGELIISFGDVHLYQNHVTHAKMQLRRSPKKLPHLHIAWGDSMPAHVSDLDELLSIREEHIILENYNPHAAIKAPVAV